MNLDDYNFCANFSADIPTRSRPMQERKQLGRKVVIKSSTKGHSGKGSKKGAKTGKFGTLYKTNHLGNLEVCYWATEPNLKKLQKSLRSTNLIPTHVTLNSKGETTF